MEESTRISGSCNKGFSIGIPVIIIIIGAFLVLDWNFFYMFDYIIYEDFYGYALIALGIFVIYCLNSCEIVVTNKRVYGKAAFRRQVDLPLSAITAVGTSGILKTISVSTSSGRISFACIKNADRIHEVIVDFLLERQDAADQAIKSITQEDKKEEQQQEN